jgi:Tfp pilus assembly protein PilP
MGVRSVRGTEVVAAAACAALLLFASAGLAQEDAPAPQSDVEEEIFGVEGEDEVDISKIEEMLRTEEGVYAGEVFSYDPAGRRDPFVSLVENRPSEEESPQARERPDGLPGMLIEELIFQGTLETPDGMVAMVQGRDKIGYLLREGTQLFNGVVDDVSPGRVVFKQQVTDPQALKPYREVVREIAE